MRVLHVIPSIGVVRGGPSHSVMAMVKALRMNGVDAEIVTTNDNGAERLSVPLNQRIEYDQVPVWFLPRFSPPLKEFLFSADLTRWLWHNVQNYDLLHNHYLFSYAPTCAGVIARYYQVPYLVKTNGQLTPWALAQSRLKKQIYTTLIERHNLNHAAAIHCTSADETANVRHFGVQAPTITLPLGVNQLEPWADAKQKLHQRYNIPDSVPIVLFLSRVHPKKNPEVLLRSLSQLAAQHEPFHLILAGEGEADYLQHLHQLVNTLNLLPQVSFAGFVTGQNKALLLQGADLFILPSFTENFGLAIAEAMAASLPVIVTPGVQIAPDILDSNAGLVVAGEVEPLSQAISQLLRDPELRQRLGQNGHRLAQERYCWDSLTQTLAIVYDAILSHRPLPSI